MLAHHPIDRMNLRRWRTRIIVAPVRPGGREARVTRLYFDGARAAERSVEMSRRTRSVGSLSGRGKRIALLGLLASFLAIPRASAQTTQTFEIIMATAPITSQDLVPIPTVAVVPSGSVPISRDLAAQLSEAVLRATRDAADGAQFMPITREHGRLDVIGWAFAAQARARAEYAVLDVSFADRLASCLHTLDANAPELAALMSLLVPIPLQNGAARKAALLGGQLMLTNFRRDHCATRANVAPSIEAQRETIVAATRGMLTSQFDSITFRGQSLLDLIDVLTPLFFDAGGVWETDRKLRIDALFSRALERGLSSATSLTVGGTRIFSSFFDWIIATRRAQPTLTRALYKTVGKACLVDPHAASAPFQLDLCLLDRKLELMMIRFGALERMSIQTKRIE